MPKPSLTTAESKTRRSIVKLLKADGPLDAQRLAAQLSVSTMAVRQHLYALAAEGLVTSEEKPVPIGRPAKHWRLTREADRLFPDAYAELNVALLEALEETFGAPGLAQLLGVRRARQERSYRERIPPTASLEQKVRRLAVIRTDEGYMASVREEEGGRLLLVENHCPICAAATACTGLCAAELELFRSVVGDHGTVERTEHILAGARRCAYLVTPRPKATANGGALGRAPKADEEIGRRSGGVPEPRRRKGLP
jgi:predicted ArsR family transcriptional regulator